MDNKIFTKRTSRIVEILQNDNRLSEGLDGIVEVLPGAPKPLIADYAIWVCRVRVDAWDYDMGGETTDITTTWAINAQLALSGDPEEMETRLSTMVANICRILFDNLTDPLWTTLQIGQSSAIEFRDRNDDTWEMEMIPVTLEFSESK